MTKKKLFEMPYLATGYMTFGLEDPELNARRKDMIVNSDPVVLWDKNGGTLYFLKSISGGQFCYVSETTKRIEYYMQYTAFDMPRMGRCATQVKVWTRASPRGISAEVFFNYMLSNQFDTMVSDRIQSYDGRRFWIRQMVEGIGLGYNIGLLSGDEIQTYDAQNDFTSWITGTDGWGISSEHHERRFYISKLLLR